VIEVRLRVPLRSYDRTAAMLGMMVEVGRVPARTTLTVVELGLERSLVVGPDGRRWAVGRETLREHGYTPRRPSGVVPLPGE
jgi:hypothetical protein